MILSDQDMFSDAQAITATARSTNTLDLGATGKPVGNTAALKRNIGKGTKIPMLIQVVEDFASAAEDGTLTFTLELDSTETFTPDKSIDLGTFNEADLKVGWKLPWDIVPKNVDLRYASMKYTVGGTGNFTAGKITAGLTMGVQTND